MGERVVSEGAPDCVFSNSKNGLRAHQLYPLCLHRLTWRERISSSSMGGGDCESSFSSLPLGRFPSSTALPVPNRLTMAVPKRFVQYSLCPDTKRFAGFHPTSRMIGPRNGNLEVIFPLGLKRGGLLSLVLPTERLGCSSVLRPEPARSRGSACRK